ncbi:exodeoxyribonuclease VII small subunit [Candidatus Pseudothioglobus singularis]|nr:exodeoxyribonuclease VII small subunit [Candidatus Pseudothioglobus singularis]
MVAEKFNFNKGLLKLEGIINKMESGDLSLEESLKYFEEGVKIHRQCHSALSDAEHRISVLSESDNYNEEKSFEDS